MTTFDRDNPLLELRRIQIATALLSCPTGINEEYIIAQLDRLFADEIIRHGFLNWSETIVIDGNVKHRRPFRQLVEHANTSAPTCSICKAARHRGVPTSWWRYRYRCARPPQAD